MFLVVSEWCLSRAKDLSASYAAVSVRMLGLPMYLGGGTARTADLD